MHVKMSSAKWRPSCLGLNVLTHLLLKSEYFVITRSIPLLLMSCHLLSPCRQQPWYWLCRMNWSSTRMVLTTCVVSFLRNDEKHKYNFIFPKINSVGRGSMHLAQCRDHSGYGLSQWETTLHCNVFYWLSPYPEWSLGMGSANERHSYIVTLSLIGWAHTQNDPFSATRTGPVFYLWLIKVSANERRCYICSH